MTFISKLVDGGPVRALAVAESMIGQMYLVVVVARLVSLYRGSSGNAL